jgi:hypothetical protein
VLGVEFVTLGERGVPVDSVERRSPAGMNERRSFDDGDLEPVED